MIKFCGNCGTTITENEISSGAALTSGNYVYCQKCARKLGLQGEGTLDAEDTKDTQEVNAKGMDLDSVFKTTPDKTTKLSDKVIKNKLSNTTKKQRSSNDSGPDKKMIQCPSCGVKLRIKTPKKPKKVRCPKCKDIFSINPSEKKITPDREEQSRVKEEVTSSEPEKGQKKEVDNQTGEEKESALESVESRDETPRSALEPVKSESEEDDNGLPPTIETQRGEVSDLSEEQESEDEGPEGEEPEEQDTSDDENVSVSGEKLGSSVSRRRSSLSSRRKSRQGSSKTVSGTIVGKGYWLLLVIILVGSGLPFLLLPISRFSKQLQSVGSSVKQGFAKIGISVEGGTALDPEKDKETKQPEKTEKENIQQ